jgi:hypothetical protein
MVVVQNLKEKAKGVGKHTLFEHKHNINLFHDSYDKLMDSANSLKSDPPPIPATQ